MSVFVCAHIQISRCVRILTRVRALHCKLPLYNSHTYMYLCLCMYKDIWELHVTSCKGCKYILHRQKVAIETNPWKSCKQQTKLHDLFCINSVNIEGLMETVVCFWLLFVSSLPCLFNKKANKKASEIIRFYATLWAGRNIRGVFSKLSYELLPFWECRLLLGFLLQNGNLSSDRLDDSAQDVLILYLY